MPKVTHDFDDIATIRYKYSSELLKVVTVSNYRPNLFTNCA